MTDHRTLVADYATRGSEPAFRELVERYIDLVYSTALRLVEGDTHRAEVVIAAVITTHGVQAAPASLASAVLVNPLLPAAGPDASGLTSALTNSMLMKKTIFIVVGVLALGAVVSVLLLKSKGKPASGPVTEKSLLEGLVLHYNFDLPEGDGVVTDESKLGNNGRATGAHWTANGKLNGAYEFTADGNEIVVPDNPSLNPGHLTLAAWVKTSHADSIWRRIFDKSYSQGYALSIAGDWQQNQWRGLVSMEIGPGTHFLLTKTRVTDGKWHHVVMTFDGTEEVFYVDGKSQSRLHWAQPGKVGATAFNLVIGCNRSNLNADDLGTSFRGVIDEPMMWNRALSEAEVAFLFDSQNGAQAAEAAAN